LTVARATGDDRGDPLEQTTRYNDDPSWKREVDEFACAILDDRPITQGSASDAYETMELVYRIYCADPAWQAQWDLCDSPNGGVPS
jgi:hypothetical protein